MKIAYLAPEIPALSATFVYNEIRALKNLGVTIDAFSVHRPESLAKDVDQALFSGGVKYLYETKKTKVLSSHLSVFFCHPWRYLCCFMMLLRDVISLGVVNRIAIGQVMRFFYAVYFSERLQKEKCQHVHVHFAHVPTDIAMYAAYLAKIGFSVTSHANDIFERGWLLQQKVARCAFFATISEFNIQHLTSLSVAVSKLRLIRCGVDSSFLSECSGRRQNDSVVFKFGAVGRLVEKKGFDTLIRAASVLKERGTKFQLRIAGSGPDQEKLVSLAKELNVQDKVDFLGALSHSDVANFCAGLDVFCLPCKTDSQGDMDGIPVVLMEAMLLGVPVISSRISGIPELIIHNATGLLVEENNFQNVADSLTRLIENPKLAVTFALKAKTHVEEEFTQTANAKKLISLFKEHTGRAL